MPVLVWGEGACAADGAAYATFLLEIASNGIMVIAAGAPGGSGTTTDQDLADAISWAKDNDGQTDYGVIDASALAAAGHSCGGR
jgi:hypothetical protein